MLRDKDADRKKNIAALAEARVIHFAKLSAKSLHELGCGIERRGEEIWRLLIRASAFDIEGQIKSQRLADYLANW